MKSHPSKQNIIPHPDVTGVSRQLENHQKSHVKQNNDAKINRFLDEKKKGFRCNLHTTSLSEQIFLAGVSMPLTTCRSGIHGNKHQSVDIWKRQSGRGISSLIQERATFLINPDLLLLFNC